MEHTSVQLVRPARPRWMQPAILLVALATAACGTTDRSADTAAADSASSRAATPTAMSMPDSSGMGSMAGMAGMTNMTGNPDRDFLRMMSDHHKGLIAMAHQATDRTDIGTASADAKKLDTEQDAGLDTMTTILEQTYKDPYAPKIIPSNQAMLDSLTPKQGRNYERTFYENVIKHHQEALSMIDAYLPNATNASVKQMAERMRAAQSRQIDEFRRKVAALGS